ncbi:MAG: 2-C-methyl-D-erythritol 2,4-cyclodiphosphate synthase, partial [Rubripirellula sp.]
MRNALSTRLKINPQQIGIKAKTGEKVDAVGRGEAISARVVVLLSSFA